MTRYPLRHYPRALSLFAVALATFGGATMAQARAFELEPQARLHFDYADYHADREPLDGGWRVRRATIGLEGQFNDDWEFEIGYGLADDGHLRPKDGGFRDVSVSYEGWAAGDITLGQFRPPFGLAQAISSNSLGFLERPLPVNAFSLSRRLGVGFSHERADYTLQTMAFGSSIDGDDHGHGLAARFTLAPIHTKQTVLHFGIAGVTQDPNDEVDIDTAPESRVADEDLVNTGGLGHVNRINRIGLESAWRSGPLSIQAEWMQTRLRRGGGHADASLDGWYVSGSWVLTGEMRPYKHGEFKGIEPDASWGAVELVTRYSRIDLDAGGVRGGKESNFTLGLNYYFNEHMRAMLDYIHVDSRRHGHSDNPDILTLRLQFVL